MADPVVPVDIQAYLLEKVAEYSPDDPFELREGSAFRDFFIKPLTFLLQPVRDELETVRFLQSLQNFEGMSEEELDSLVANFFLPRRGGSLAVGTVRLFFAAPQRASVTRGSAFLSAAGLRFLADEDTQISSASMSVNVDGSSFFLDVALTAEAAGAQYNLEPGGIVTMEVPISGLVRVTNPARFQGGLATETNTELYNRAQTAVTVRNLVNDRSIVTTLLDRFSFVKSVVPIGFNDPEMERAALTLVLPGPPQHTVTIPDRGGHADIYIEGDGFEGRSTTVQMAPESIGTNSDRGTVVILTVGYRRIRVTGGYFGGLRYPGNPLVNLLANLKYTLSLKLAPSGTEYELDLLSTPVANPYPAVPPGQIPLANLQTDGATVVSLTDIREDVFSFDRPVMAVDSVELLDPLSLQPTGVVLRTGEDFLIPPSIAADPGSVPHAGLDRGTGHVHLAFKRTDGVYYQRHDSLGNVAQAAVLVSANTGATNLRLTVTNQGDAQIFFLTSAGALRHLKVDNTGAVLVAESTVSGAGTTLEFEAAVDLRGAANLLTINNALGQPDVYFIQVDEAGAISTAQVLLQTTAGTAASPALVSNQDVLELSNAADSGTTAGSDILTDLSATFLTDGVAPGHDFVLLSGTGLPAAEQGVYTVLAVPSETQVQFSGAPVITAATNIVYEVLPSTGGLATAWTNDLSGNRQVRAMFIAQTGLVSPQFGGQHLVLSDPTQTVDCSVPALGFDPANGTAFTAWWARNGTDLEAIGLGNLATTSASTTGDTQGTGLSRSFFDASNPFVPTDVGRYLSIVAGSGLTDVDFRLYEIEEFISAGHVLLAEPVTDSLAADIEYTINTLRRPRQLVAPGRFSGQITALAVLMDDHSGQHVGAVETTGNSGTVWYGKFDLDFLPLLRQVFLRVSASVNNREALTVFPDASRQPWLVWGDFSASRSTVQLAKLQAQEFAYLVNDPGTSLSVREDARVVLDPNLVGQSVRVNYQHSSRVATVEDFAVGTVNRIVIGNYLVRHTRPAYVDVSLTYGGSAAPDEDAALTAIVDFINAIGSTVTAPSIEAVVTQSVVGESLEISDLIDLLYDLGADSVRAGSELLVDELQTDGTIRRTRSIDRVSVTRTARLTARVVTVVRE